MIRGVQSDGAGAGVTGVQPVWNTPHTFALARLALPPPTLWSTSGLERLGLFDQFDELALDADALPPRRMGLPGQSQKDKTGGPSITHVSMGEDWPSRFSWSFVATTSSLGSGFFTSTFIFCAQITL